MKEEEFNPKQQQAIQTQGNVFVIGNPGTGKTKLLVGRIEYLLSKGIDPNQILCMTFTLKATEELKTRLINKLSDKYPQVSNVQVDTFHSYAINTVKPYLLEQGLKTNVIKEGMQRFLIYKIIKQMQIFDYGDSYLKDLAYTLSSKLSYLRSFTNIELDIEQIITKWYNRLNIF